MRPLYCFKRSNGYYYIQFFNPQLSKRSTAISTHKKDRDAALFVAFKWQEQGIPQKKAPPKTITQILFLDETLNKLQNTQLGEKDLQKILDVLITKGIKVETKPAEPPKKPVSVKPDGHAFIQFLLDFWNYDTSKYIQGLLAHGTSITRRHCYEMTNRVNNYWEPVFGKTITIEELKDEDIEEFLLKQKTEKNLSGATINKILHAARKPLKWALKKNIIKSDPTASLDSFSSKIKERGILEDTEVQALIVLDWKVKRARVATLTAMTTGLRAGELLALRVQDIRENKIMVEHDWNTLDGLKSTKNGKVREVILLPYIRTILLEYAKTNPHGFSPDTFIFYSPLYPNQPCDTGKFNDGFYEALAAIKITEEMRKARNIVFHSWRHYNATIIADHLDERTAQLLLGHLTASMTKRYADHATKKKLDIAATALDDTFGTAFKFGSGTQ